MAQQWRHDEKLWKLLQTAKMWILLLIFASNLKLVHLADPVISSLPRTVYYSEDYNGGGAGNEIRLGGFDPDGGKVDWKTATIASTPAGPFSLSGGGDKFRIDSPTNFDYQTINEYSVTVCVDDDQGETGCGILTIKILQNYYPPVIGNLPKTIEVKEKVSGEIYDVSAFDTDNPETLTYTITASSVAGLFSINAGNGKITLNTAQDYNTDPHTFTVDVQVSDTHGYVVGPETLTINLKDVNEAPTLDNMPYTTSFSEDVVTGQPVFTVQASDTDGDTLTWTYVAVPDIGPFVIDTVTNDKEAAISFSSNPGFNYELVRKYTITLYASDGLAVSQPDTVTINIDDANEPITITNLPATVSLPEDSAGDVNIYQVAATDVDIGDTFTFSIHATTPSSGNGKFAIDATTGKIKVNASPNFDFEAMPTYTVIIKGTDSGGLTSTGTLTINIEDVNEEPTFATKVQYATVLEQSATTVTLSGVTIIASDPDAGETLTYTLDATGYGSYFRMDAGPVLAVDKVIDYENPNDPRIFTLEVTTSDKEGLDDVTYIVVSVEDINDNAPAFLYPSYTAEVEENLPGDVDLVYAQAFDPDSGDNGAFTYSLDAWGEKYCSIDPNTGLVILKQPVDREALGNLNFTVTATDNAGQTGTAYVTVTILDVNDNPPGLSKTFWNFEVREDATISEHVGLLTASDPDIETVYPLNFYLTIATEYFAVAKSSGVISVAEPFIQSNKYSTYELAAQVKDNGSPQFESLSERIRVDTYVACECLINVDVALAPSAFSTAASRSAFRSAMNQVLHLETTVAKLVYVNGQAADTFSSSTTSNSSTQITMLYLTDASTDDVNNIAVAKSYVHVPRLLAVMHISNDTTLSSNLLSVMQKYPLTKVSAYQECPWQEDVDINWWLETPEGLATTCILSIIACLLVLAALIAAIYYIVKACQEWYAGRPPPVRKTGFTDRPITSPPPYSNKKTANDFDLRHNPRDKAYQFRNASSVGIGSSYSYDDDALKSRAPKSTTFTRPQMRTEVVTPREIQFRREDTDLTNVSDTDDDDGFESRSPSPDSPRYTPRRF